MFVWFRQCILQNTQLERPGWIINISHLRIKVQQRLLVVVFWYSAQNITHNFFPSLKCIHDSCGGTLLIDGCLHVVMTYEC